MTYLPDHTPFETTKKLRTRDRLLIVCPGRNVWEDVEKSGYDRGLGMDVMCVKDILIHFHADVNHGFSEHPDQLIHCLALRRLRRKIAAKQTSRIFLHAPFEGFESVHGWQIKHYGCSGLGAAVVGLCLGYKEIVLAGSPLDDSGHYYDAPWMKTSLARQFPGDAPKVWLGVARHVFKGRVKSLSGRTKELLGGPD